MPPTAIISMIAIVGIIEGMVTCMTCCIRVAPSSLADSYSDVSIAVMADIKDTVKAEALPYVGYCIYDRERRGAVSPCRALKSHCGRQVVEQAVGLYERNDKTGHDNHRYEVGQVAYRLAYLAQARLTHFVEQQREDNRQREAEHQVEQAQLYRVAYQTTKVNAVDEIGKVL